MLIKEFFNLLFTFSGILQPNVVAWLAVHHPEARDGRILGRLVSGDYHLTKQGFLLYGELSNGQQCPSILLQLHPHKPWATDNNIIFWLPCLPKINDFLTKQFPHQPPRAPSLVKCPPLCCSITLRHHLSFLKGNHMLAILTEDSSVSFFLPPFSASSQLRWRQIEKVSRQIRCQPLLLQKQSAAH